MSEHTLQDSGNYNYHPHYPIPVLQPEGEEPRTDFNGQVTNITGKSMMLITGKIRNPAIYAVKDGKFVLKKGDDPVPGF